MGPLTSEEYQSHLNQSDLFKKYKETVDPRSAFEILTEKLEAIKQEQTKREEEIQETRSTPKSSRKEKSTFEEVLSSPVTKQIGKEIVRGVFGMLFGSAPRRTRSR